MLYLGIFGLTLPTMGLLSIQGNILRKDWTSLGIWTQDTNTHTGAYTIVNGILTTRGTFMNIDTQWDYIPNDFTVEFRMRANVWAGTDYASIKTHPHSKTVCIEITGSAVILNYGVGLRDSKPLITPVDVWYIWTYTVQSATPKITLYRDGTEVASWNRIWDTITYTKVCLGTMRDSVVDASFDYLYIETGLHSPNGGDPPPDDGYGTLDIKAYYTDFVHVDFALQGPDGSTTLNTGNSPFVSMPVGSYTISCTSYQGHVCTNTPHSFSLTKDTTYSYTFTFEGADPPPPDPDGFLEWLIGIFSDSTVKTINTIGGVGLLGLGVIMLVIPGKKYMFVPGVS